MGLFLSEEMEYNPGARQHGAAVYERYRSWCRDSGYSTESKGTFFKLARERQLMGYCKVGKVPDKNAFLDYDFLDEFL